MITIMQNDLFGYTVPVASDVPGGAENAAKRITGIDIGWSILPDEALTVDELIESIDSWWGDFCDRADGNDDISDAEFDAILEINNDAAEIAFDM